MDPERRVGLIMAGITALLWGFLALAMKVATGYVPVFTIVWFRFAFAFVLLFLGIASKDVKRIRILGKPPLLGFIAALALTGNYLGYLSGLHHTTPSNAQILIQVAPLMLAMVGIFVFKERLIGPQWFGVLIAVSGFALFAFDQHQAAVVPRSEWLLGNGLLFLGAISWVWYAANTKVLTGRGWAPQDLNLLIYSVPAVILIPWVDFSVLAGLSWKLWILMGFLGANTLVAYGCLGEAFKRLPAYQVSLIVTLNPLITLAVMAILGLWTLDWLPPDRVGPLGYGAAFLVVGGVIQVLRKASPMPKPADLPLPPPIGKA